jgi:predicted 3-demethylubiquinone-9 3-methyltransferase (glyoxalase superfamily)
LLDGGKEAMCGWLSDRYGVSWQVVPDKLGNWMRDPERSKRVSGAFMQMKKLGWDKLENA